MNETIRSISLLVCLFHLSRSLVRSIRIVLVLHRTQIIEWQIDFLSSQYSPFCIERQQYD